MSSESEKSLSPEAKTRANSILSKYAVYAFEEGEKYTDLRIIAKNNTEIFAHKIILHAQSGVFRILIHEVTVKSKSENGFDGITTLEMKDFDAVLVKRLLSFIYAKRLVESEVDIDLFRLAHKYNIRDLKNKCQRILSSKLSAENAAEILYYANECKAKNLERDSMDFIRRNCEAVTDSNAWKQVKTLPNAIELLDKVLKIVLETVVYLYPSGSDKSSSPERKETEAIADLDKYASFVGNGQFSDAMIISNDGHAIPAHKVILCTQVDYFGKMFAEHFKDFKEEKGPIEMKDFEMKVILSMLTYIYTGKVNNSEIDFELLGIANKYQVKGLKDKCERCLISQLSMDNVIDALVWAAHYNANDLEEEAMEIIISNPDLAESKRFDEMSKKEHINGICAKLFKKIMKRIKEDGYSPSKKRPKK